MRIERPSNLVTVVLNSIVPCVLVAGFYMVTDQTLMADATTLNIRAAISPSSSRGQLRLRAETSALAAPAQLRCLAQRPTSGLVNKYMLQQEFKVGAQRHAGRHGPLATRDCRVQVVGVLWDRLSIAPKDTKSASHLSKACGSCPLSGRI